ncbi:hypothetical protein [Halomarina pelagica]|uniref:hypothetical protein n=1 Tax=Halomarina pelagica TaxID=2961599 RepID=UPI0020C2750E|nr:hypothetical protein [Halomarina sp. BND7]
MDEISLGVPQPIIDVLPDDDGTAAADMRRAVEGLEDRVNRAIREADDDAEAAGFAMDVVEHLEERARRYDEFIPELRAWGQSPVYAIAWRNLQADLIAQLYEHEELAARLDQERNYRIVEDGIRLSDVFKD